MTRACASNGSVLSQTTSEVITAEGVSYVLKADVRNSWQGSPKIALYYDNAGHPRGAGKRVPAGQWRYLARSGHHGSGGPDNGGIRWQEARR